jgi:hypothetical protein
VDERTRSAPSFGHRFSRDLAIALEMPADIVDGKDKVC